jgi:biotin transport system ATP-binding protein/energy-coupling factor transport system ATP-binding protein
MDPKLIVLDEPTSSLDPIGKKTVLDLLQKLKGQGIGIIHITHSMDEAALADRILVMDRGELIADGSPGQVLSRVEWLKSLGLAPPHVTELMWQLQQQGEMVGTNIFTIDHAANEITALLTQLRAVTNSYIPRKAGGHV